MRAGVVFAIVVGILWNLFIVLPFLLIVGGSGLIAIMAGAQQGWR